MYHLLRVCEHMFAQELLSFFNTFHSRKVDMVVIMDTIIAFYAYLFRTTSRCLPVRIYRTPSKLVYPVDLNRFTRGN